MRFLLACLGATPFVCLASTIAYFYFRPISQGQAGTSPRPGIFPAAATGSVVWSLLILIQANLLSFLDLLAAGPILFFWLFYLAVALLALFSIRKKISIEWNFPRAWMPVFLILAFTLIGALAYAPSFHDSLAYHITRVMHWLQNGSMAPYATSIDRQIGMAPFNAIVIMQSMAINGDDYFVNLPQWLAFAGCVCGAAHLCRQLGASDKARVLSAFYFCSLPIAIMQSGNSESSLIATFWLCVFTSSFLNWRESPGLHDSAMLGASLGLAILSKGIAYPVALPFVICIAWKCLSRFKTCFLYGALAAAIILAINLPHFYRNYTATHSLVLSAERNIILKPYPGLVAVNALFNFLSQEPWIANLAPGKGWSNLAASLGVDDHDPVLFPWRGIETVRTNMVPSDIDGQSPLHAILILFFIPWLIWRRPPGSGFYLGLVCATFLVFFTLITWQPWVARLHLPFFLLCAPLMGVALTRLAWSKIRTGLLLGLGVTSFMPLFFCLEHPLGPTVVIEGYRPNIAHFLTSSRDEQYFNLWRDIRKSYIAAANYLAEQKPAAVGVDLADDGQEYPLWAILRKKLGDKMPRIVHAIPPWPADGPEYIFRQRHSSFSVMPNPEVFKKSDGKYVKVFPAERTGDEGN